VYFNSGQTTATPVHSLLNAVDNEFRELNQYLSADNFHFQPLNCVAFVFYIDWTAVDHLAVTTPTDAGWRAALDSMRTEVLERHVGHRGITYLTAGGLPPL
jgi:hypothetical protein